MSPIIILGMHRSGTSCLTGCLQEAGLYLGDVNTKAGFNAKGNRENRSIMDLHEGILNRVGASWDNPPKTDPKWTEGEIEVLKSIISDYENHKIWGTKDPRALYMMNGWTALTTPRFIGTFRHPAEVAASLIHRANVWKQDMELGKALSIWASYNQRMLTHFAENPFDIIRFDVEPKTYENKLILAGEKLGLEMPRKIKFREADLHNQHKDNIEVPADLQSIWEALNDLAI